MKLFRSEMKCSKQLTFYPTLFEEKKTTAYAMAFFFCKETYETIHMD